MLITTLVLLWIALGIWLVLAFHKVVSKKAPPNDNPRMRIVR